MNVDKEREAFEVWVADRKVVTKYGAKTKWQPIGQCYLDYRINDRWLAWQARAALSAEAGPVAEALAELRTLLGTDGATYKKVAALLTAPQPSAVPEEKE